MIDAIVIALLVLSLVFFAGLHIGSKRPVHRAQRQLSDLRREKAVADAQIQMISPLRARATELAARQKRVDFLITRQSELDVALAATAATLSDLRHQKEHNRLTPAKLAIAEQDITHLSCERLRLAEALQAVLDELTPLRTQLSTDIAAFEVERATAQIADGAGFQEFVSATIAA